MSRDTVSRCLGTSLHFGWCSASRLRWWRRPRRGQGRGPAGGLRPALTSAAVARLGLDRDAARGVTAVCLGDVPIDVSSDRNAYVGASV
jgi:hypothetical protein